jgi:hypothetical protein
MSTSINTFKNVTEYISNKVQSGNSLTIPQFNELANVAQMTVFEKDRAIFVAKAEVSDYLKQFLVSKTYNSNSLFGELVLPDDLEHISSIRSYHIKGNGAGMEVPLSEVKNTDWGKVTSSSLFAATNRFPKYSEYDAYVKYLPVKLNNITVDYFRTPLAPEWAYTVVNGRPVYDATNSINFEWYEATMNNVVAAFLQLVGVNLKDSELYNFTQSYKQETNVVL